MMAIIEGLVLKKLVIWSNLGIGCQKVIDPRFLLVDLSEKKNAEVLYLSTCMFQVNYIFCL